MGQASDRMVAERPVAPQAWIHAIDVDLAVARPSLARPRRICPRPDGFARNADQTLATFSGGMSRHLNFGVVRERDLDRSSGSVLQDGIGSVENAALRNAGPLQHATFSGEMHADAHLQSIAWTGRGRFLWKIASPNVAIVLPRSLEHLPDGPDVALLSGDRAY